MDKSKFDIATDDDLKLLRVTLRGFWDGATMADYMQCIRAAMADLQRIGGCELILINMSDYPIQTKDVADGHAANLHAVKKLGAAKVALVMQSGLSKLQARRVVEDTGHRAFNSEEEALAWLCAR
jgi:hypothetical protein